MLINDRYQILIGMFYHFIMFLHNINFKNCEYFYEISIVFQLILYRMQSQKTLHHTQHARTRTFTISVSKGCKERKKHQIFITNSNFLIIL